MGLASAASAAGIPTLVVDMDPQGTPRRSRRHRHRVTVNDVLYATSEASLPKRSRPHGRMCQ
ncbi:hypothetical protein GS942_20830 [Rhodococcus hoagii]|nr:hypothetical protein [Prescottella equi]